MGWLFICLLKLLLSLILPFCTSQNNLVPGKSINANQTLTSSTGTIALGFFSPENSTKYFLGIWYNAKPNSGIVWVANRESPLDSPGVFTLGSDGNLVLLDGTTKALIWSSNASVPASVMNATTGLLMDTGNLVLRFGDSLWQSFDHPFDTLLPGMKLSVNKRTGQQRRLTSWALLDDPQPGKFTLGIDPQVSVQGFIWKENAPHWRSSIHIGKETRTAFNSSGTAYFLIYSFDADEVYLTYGVSDSSVKLRAMLI